MYSVKVSYQYSHIHKLPMSENAEQYLPWKLEKKIRLLVDGWELCYTLTDSTHFN